MTRITRMVHKSAHETHELREWRRAISKTFASFRCLVGETMAHRILCFLIRVYSCVSWAEPSVAPKAFGALCNRWFFWGSEQLDIKKLEREQKKGSLRI